MPARLIDIAELQPTDTLRLEAQSYFESLSLNEIAKRHGLPQVCETSHGLLISDGNQRTASYAKKKIAKIEVDFQQTSIPDYFLDYLNLVISQAEVLRKQGIYSPLDLWQA